MQSLSTDIQRHEKYAHAKKNTKKKPTEQRRNALHKWILKHEKRAETGREIQQATTIQPRYRPTERNVLTAHRIMGGSVRLFGRLCSRLFMHTRRHTCRHTDTQRQSERLQIRRSATCLCGSTIGDSPTYFPII